VSESTLEAPAVPESERPEPRPDTSRARLPTLIRRHPWWIVGIALVVFSTVLVYWTNTRPGYDPYGWLIWGYQTIHLSLDLGGAPSWKPLPWLFTVPYSLFGHSALRLWMITAVAISLSQSIFAARIAYRLTGRSQSGSAWPAIAAAVFAGLAILGIQDYFHYILSVQSDPMIVALCLGAIDCHLSGHRRWAFALAVLASLGRPEVWPFLGIYAVWAWTAVPSMRWFVFAGVALIPILWFGVPTITNDRPFVSGQLALLSPRELHQNKIIGTLHRFTALTYLPLQLMALVAIGLAWLRRNWTVLILAAGAVGWILVELAFVLHGWPGVPRYLFEPAGVMIVLASVAVGWLLQEAPLGVGARGAKIPRLVGVAVAVIAAGALVPGAVARLRTEHRDLRHERERTKAIGWLQADIEHLGGYKHVLACGEPVTTVRYVAMLAYFTKQNDGKIGHRPQWELKQTYPIVMFTPLHSGWGTFPWHTAASKVAACRDLNAKWIYTRPHPNGVLVRTPPVTNPIAPQ
jgi:hypothetical protein